MTDAFAITGGGRFNHALIMLEDQLGTALHGDHNYDRFNKIIGGPTRSRRSSPPMPVIRKPTACRRRSSSASADPNKPCLIASFLVSDPPLKQVVSKTIEAGLRGAKELNIGTLGWKIGGFRATNYDDIMGLPVAGRQGFGFFQNLGATRRQRLEAEVQSRIGCAPVPRKLCLRRCALPRWA